MRAAAGLPPLMIAARLAADQQTMAALENGDVLALPETQETTRIVTTYGRMVGIDPTIALHRIAILREESGGPSTRLNADAQSFAATPPFAGKPPLQPAQSPRPVNPLDPSTGGWIAPSQHAPGHGTGLAHLHPRTLPGPANRGAPPPRPQAVPADWNPPPPVPRLQTQQPQSNNRPSMPAMSAMPAAVTSLPAVNPLQPPERPARSEPETAGRRAAARASSAPPYDGVETSRRRHPARTALKYVTVPMMVVAGLWYTVQNPTSVHAALAQLPEPLPRIAQAGMEIVLVNTAPTKDGLRMITASDPRSRKADKLQVRREASR